MTKITKDSKNTKAKLVTELATAIEAVLKHNDGETSKKIGKTIQYASEEIVKKFLKRVKEKDKKAEKAAKKTAGAKGKAKVEEKPKAKKAPVTKE